MLALDGKTEKGLVDDYDIKRCVKVNREDMEGGFNYLHGYRMKNDQFDW